MSKQVILTGLRTNAEYHLGNYLGALLPMVDMANNRAGEYQVNIFAPDLHSFTTPIDFKTFHTQTMHNLKLFAACGFPLDHKDVYMYRQSYIPAHSELAWILSNFTGMGEMSRMVEFKDKSARLSEDRISVGLFSYPILMAADILLYGATYVPVGEDQRQHLEFTRDIAVRFNNQFGEVFVVPETLANQQKFIERESAPRIRSLRDPSRKMSKSIDDPSGTILLGDSPEEASKKVMRAETDALGLIKFDWEKQPGVTNLLQMLALLTHRRQEDVNKEWEGQTSYGTLKGAVADAVSRTLGEIQAKLATVTDETLEAKLVASEEAMNGVANQTLHNVQQAVGLRPKT